MPDRIFETTLARRLQLRAAKIATESPADEESGNGKIGAIRNVSPIADDSLMRRDVSIRLNFMADAVRRSGFDLAGVPEA